jgi:predicted GNAT family N-acyltransferase
VLIKLITPSSPEYPAMLDLRDAVLRKPLGMELDRSSLSDEVNDFLVICMEEDKMLGCVILSLVSGNTLKLRQMAVAEDAQGKGIGSMIVEWAEKLAFEKGYRTIEMHARKYAIPFYEKAGYSAYGEEFNEVGIPHIRMQKQLL